MRYEGERGKTYTSLVAEAWYLAFQIAYRAYERECADDRG